MPSTDNRERLLKINRAQERFYESDRYANWANENFIGRRWSDCRARFHHLMASIGVEQSFTDLHKEWLGDLSDKKILDLGPGGGNQLSVYLARNGKEYHAIDLSEKLLKSLRAKLDAAGLKNTKAYRRDFLSPAFTEAHFEVIYAVGVAHHFKYFDVFLQVLKEKTTPRGIVIIYDPLNATRLTRLVRSVYRPFQADADWEWPFTEKTFDTIQQYFTIERIQGFFGRSKWALPIGLLSQRRAIAFGKIAHQYDLRKSNTINAELFKCLHVTMLLRNAN